jgi:hypothetical protein
LSIWITITFPETTDPHGAIYFLKVNRFKNNKHAIRLMFSIYMPVEPPVFERVRSLSEYQTFPTHCKLQYIYIRFIPCFLITDISGCISINLITNSEQVTDINIKDY